MATPFSLQHNTPATNPQQDQPFIDQARDIHLPNDESFVIFGSDQSTTQQLHNVIKRLLQEDHAAQNTAVFVHYRQ